MNMEPELNKKIEELDVKINAVYVSVEKTRKYFLIIVWITILGVVLPLVGLMFVLPSFMANYVDTLSGLGM